MSTQTVPSNLAGRKRRFSVENYHRLGEVGILGPDERVELIEGEIIKMAPIGSVHVSVVNRLNELFFRRLLGQAIVSVQNPVILKPSSEPQPDISLLSPRQDQYRNSLPEPEDVLLLVEVADTTLAYDMSKKVPLYAAQGIQEVWIVDVEADRVHVFREPTEKGYDSIWDLPRGRKFSLLGFPDVEIAVDEVLG